MKLRKTFALALTTAMAVNAGVELLSQGGSETARIRFTIPEYKIDTVEVNGKQYSRVQSGELNGITLDKGLPELPYIAEALQLGSNGDVSLSIASVKYKEIDVLPVLPSKGNLTRNIDLSSAPVVEDGFYNEDKWFPEAPVQLGTPYSIRDINGVSARMFPFAYNPATGKLRVAEEIVFSVEETGGVASRSATAPSEEFNSVVANRFLNSSEKPLMSRYSSVYDGDKMLIVTASDFKESAERLAQWKNRKGISTEVVVYPTETGGTGHENLKSYIQNQYDQNGITYVTLVGDYEDIPSKLRDYSVPNDYPSQDDNDVSSDPTYAYLSGNDYYPDIFVGRISVETASQADVVVDKIITYEKTPDVGGSWYKKAVSIGSDEGTPRDYEWMSDSINPYLEQKGFTQIDEIYQGFGESNSKLSNALNEGRSIVNFMGHGYNDGIVFSNSPFRYRISDVNALRNGDKLPVVIPLACQLGTFKGRTVAAEAWIRKENGGAIAIMASTPLMDWTPPQYAQVEMARLMSRDAHLSMGAYFYNGEMKMMDVSYSGTKTMHTWNYFGDPSLQLFTDAPEQINLSVSGNVAVGSNQITVSGERDVQVTLYSANLNIFETAKLTTGSVSFNFDAADTGTIYITGTKRNGAPYLDSIVVADVAEENVAPTDILLSNDTIVADAPIGTIVGEFTAVDENKRDSHMFTLSCSCDGVALDSNVVYTTKPLEVGEYVLAVTAVDDSGMAVTRDFTLVVKENPYFNLISNGSWYAENDSAGSSSEFSVDSIDTKPYVIKGSIGRAKNPKYDKWANVCVAFPEGDFSEVTNMTITYSATDSMKLVLPMKELATSGAGHYLLLPATGRNKLNTITFTADDLVQPEWSLKDYETVFNHSEVSGVLLELACQDTMAAEGSFEIHALGIEGFVADPVYTVTGNALAQPRAVALKSITSNGMSIAVPATGAYKIELYSLNGRRLFNQSISLSTGVTSIPFTASAARGISILKVAGPQGIYTTKTMIK